MESRRFGLSRIGSSNKVSRLIRQILGLGESNTGVSSTASANENDQQSAFNVRAYIIGKQRVRELETEKAMLTSISRYERWNAGGPA